MSVYVEQRVPDSGHTHTHTQTTDVPVLECEYLTSLNPSVQLFMRKDTKSLVNINTAVSLLLLLHLCCSPLHL